MPKRLAVGAPQGLGVDWEALESSEGFFIDVARYISKAVQDHYPGWCGCACSCTDDSFGILYPRVGLEDVGIYGGGHVYFNLGWFGESGYPG